MIFPPKLPFPNFKWQWASVQCTEGINYPPVLLGVLRAARNCEGLGVSSEEFLRELQQVEKDMPTSIRLARSGERNIIRNSGQYWKGFGLMEGTPGKICLTSMGRKVADGRITPLEFASHVVANHELPNAKIQSPETVRQWRDAGLRIKPLLLILNIVAALLKLCGKEEAHITPEELCRIVIPMSGVPGKTPGHYAEVIIGHRRQEIKLDDWPNCTPKANDARMAREFLLFLSHYRFLRKENAQRRSSERYTIEAGRIELETTIPPAVANSAQLDLESYVVRRIVSGVSYVRPGQARFREQVMRCFEGKCLITGADVPEVLQAAHIKPVKDKGTNAPSNGICLRADIHLLFDFRHLRIQESGRIILSDTASRCYNFIPEVVVLPPHVDRNMIKWRERYL